MPQIGIRNNGNILIGQRLSASIALIDVDVSTDAFLTIFYEHPLNIDYAICRDKIVRGCDLRPKPTFFIYVTMY